MSLEAAVAHIDDPEERAEALAVLTYEVARRRRRAGQDRPRVPRVEKHCHKCSTTKPIEEFGLDRSKPDGRYRVCRACR